MGTKTTGCVSLRILWAAVLTILLGGCLKQKQYDCPVDYCLLTVRAYDNAGAELTKSDVESVTLYVFDSRGHWVRTLDAHIGQSVRVQTIPGEILSIIAWGNTGEGHRIHEGTQIDQFSVELLPALRSDPCVTQAQDLFSGSIVLEKGTSQAEQELSIYRQMGSMSITARNLDLITGHDGQPYSFVVRETFSRIGFDGTLWGDKISYRPVSSGTVAQLETGPFHLIPEEEGVAIGIYRGESLAATVTRNDDDTPIVVRRGELTNVLIEMRGAQINVSTALTPWGEQQVWKEF